jgi:hypothetical protein
MHEFQYFYSAFAKANFMKTYCYSSILLLLFMTILTSCSIKKHKNLDYITQSVTKSAKPTLNVFSSRCEQDSLQTVLIFVYGGNWNSGRKGIYSIAGRNFARHGATVVIPDYTKSPDATALEMTAQIAQAINWTKENIATYGGDPNRIFITGHSAGGHLAALATMDKTYNVPQNTIKGIILNDAAGLDMFSYFKQVPPTSNNDYVTTWSKDPDTWKAASPYYYIDQQTPDMLLYVGTKTYQSIEKGNSRFLSELQKVQPKAKIQYLDKKHAPMVTQFFFPWNKRIDEIIAFMKR